MTKRFPNSQQKVGTKNCGPVCLLNVYNHFKIKTSLEKIMTELNVTEENPTHLPQLARHLANNKLKTLFISSNPHTVSPNWKGKNKDAIIPMLKEWILLNYNHEWQRAALFLLFYLQEGGEILITDMTTEIIDKYLALGYIIVTCLEQSWLWDKRKILGKQEYDDVKGNARGHFVIIYGEENNKYLVSDPFPTRLKEREGIYSVSKDTMLVSTLTWGAQILAIKK